MHEKPCVDDAVVTCDGIEDTPESGAINPGNGINSWLITVVLLAIAFLLLLVVVIVKYHIKYGLTTPFFLSYYNNDCGKWCFQRNNKNYFTRNKDHMTCYGLWLFTNWMRRNHKKILKQFLEKEGFQVET